jgi:hypothetical protein
MRWEGIEPPAGRIHLRKLCGNDPGYHYPTNAMNDWASSSTYSPPRPFLFLVTQKNSLFRSPHATFQAGPATDDCAAGAHTASGRRSPSVPALGLRKGQDISPAPPGVYVFRARVAVVLTSSP